MGDMKVKMLDHYRKIVGVIQLASGDHVAAGPEQWPTGSAFEKFRSTLTAGRRR
jgi:hypothetical protein